MHPPHVRVIFSTLILWAIFLSVPTHAASFNCAHVRASDERAVCTSRALSEMDVEGAVRFETLAGRVAMGTHGDMGDEQMMFLRQPSQRGMNISCLTALYQPGSPSSKSSTRA